VRDYSQWFIYIFLQNNLLKLTFVSLTNHFSTPTSMINLSKFLLYYIKIIIFKFFYSFELKIHHQLSIAKAFIREGSDFPKHNPIQLSHFPINRTYPLSITHSHRVLFNLVIWKTYRVFDVLCRLWVFNLFEYEIYVEVLNPRRVFAVCDIYRYYIYIYISLSVMCVVDLAGVCIVGGREANLRPWRDRKGREKC
jgi:hypothetical protein